MSKFTVLRRHAAARDYFPGDTREADPDEVRHLVEAGVLEPIEAAKAAPGNKAEGAAPENKGRARNAKGPAPESKAAENKTSGLAPPIVDRSVYGSGARPDVQPHDE